MSQVAPPPPLLPVLAGVPGALELAPGTALADPNLPTEALTTLLVDDSGSMQESGKAEATTIGHNALVDQFRAAAASDPAELRAERKLRTCFLNGADLSPYAAPAQAVHMTSRNYRPSGDTPLFSRALDTLLAVEAQTALLQGTKNVLTFTAIMTDGEAADHDVSADDVKVVVDRMLAAGRHIIIGIGVGPNFRETFRAMGIPDDKIVELEISHDAIVAGVTHLGGVASTIIDPGTFTQTSTMDFSRTGTGVPPNLAPGGTAAGTRGTGRATAWAPPPPRAAAAAPAAPAAAPTAPAFTPADYGLRYNGTDWQTSTAWPVTWDTATGMHELQLPADGSTVIIGRGDAIEWDQNAQAAIARILAERQKQGLTGEVVYVPLTETTLYQGKSHISRVHAVITNRGGVVSIQAQRGNLKLTGPNNTMMLDNNVADPSRTQSATLDSGTTTVQLARASRSQGTPALEFKVVKR